MLHTLLYEERAFGVFLLVTVVLGGGASWLAGRAIARVWRPWWNVVLATMLIGGAVRFIHFALFSATLLTLHYYLVDTAFAAAFGLAGYRFTRTRQMVRQYGFLRRP